MQNHIKFLLCVKTKLLHFHFMLKTSPSTSTIRSTSTAYSTNIPLKKHCNQNISSKNLVLSSPLHLTYHFRLFIHFGAARDFSCWTDGLCVLTSWYCMNIFLSCTAQLLYILVSLQKKKGNDIGNTNTCFPTCTADPGSLWHRWVKPFLQTHAQPDLLVFTLNHLQQVKNKPTTPVTAATASGQPLTNQRESGHSAILYLQRQNDLVK